MHGGCSGSVEVETMVPICWNTLYGWSCCHACLHTMHSVIMFTQKMCCCWCWGWWLALLCQQRINLWFYVTRLFSPRFLRLFCPVSAAAGCCRKKRVLYCSSFILRPATVLQNTALLVAENIKKNKTSKNCLLKSSKNGIRLDIN